MAAENLKSTNITNATATPIVANTIGHAFKVAGSVTAAGGDAGSTYRFFSIPSNAKAIDLAIWCDDLGSGTLNIGLYDAFSGSVVDADFFASALDTGTAALAGTQIAHESGVYSLANAEKPLWEALGLSKDPCKLYDVTAVSVSSAATGAIVLKSSFTV